MEEPQIYVTFKSNPVMSFIVLFMINNYGASQLSTGAFEVMVGDNLIFSKLKTGKMPAGKLSKAICLSDLKIVTKLSCTL